MEYWDAYDENKQKIEGVTLIRGEKIPEKYFHLVSSIIVRHKDGTYLLMLRDSSKAHGGGTWELSGNGSVLKGESALEGAVRELKEETGIFCPELKELKVTVKKDFQTIYTYYLAETDCDKDSVTLQQGETAGYKWVSRKELESLSAESFLNETERNLVFELGL